MALTAEASFNELLDRQGLSARQRSLAFTRIVEIRDYLSGQCVMAEPVFSIGSFARGTMCEGERDIDLMMILDADTYWSRYQNDSSEFLYACRNTLAKKYTRTDVSSKRVAVVLDFDEIRTEVVPGFARRGGGYLIPSGTGGWQATNPPYHTQLVAERDAAAAGRLKPVIKLMKLWNLANGHRLASVHVELMVVAAEALPITSWPFEVTFCLGKLRSLVPSWFADPWMYGGAIDRGLADTDRSVAAALLETDLKRATDAEAYRKAGNEFAAIDRWRVVYSSSGGSLFPAYG
jgi:hypothetical protein